LPGSVIFPIDGIILFGSEQRGMYAIGLVSVENSNVLITSQTSGTSNKSINDSIQNCTIADVTSVEYGIGSSLSPSPSSPSFETA
jgi:hypothetical protein